MLKKRYSGSSRPALEHLCYLLSACSRPALAQLSACSRPVLGLFSACSRPVLALFSPCSRRVLGQASLPQKSNIRAALGQLSSSSVTCYRPANVRTCALQDSYVLPEHTCYLEHTQIRAQITTSAHAHSETATCVQNTRVTWNTHKSGHKSRPPHMIHTP
jgi:hypothetical protein